MPALRTCNYLVILLMGCRIAAAQVAPLQSSRMVEDGDRVREISLDGSWQAGLDRVYDRTLQVPGLSGDPAQMTVGTLWYKRTVQIPGGAWTRATLTLKGARFAPKVYVNGTEVSEAEGGMAPTVHEFSLPQGSTDRTVTLEIALKSQKNLDPQDASKVPGADLWRTNVSSYLWDSVVLRLHGMGEIVRVVPASDLVNDAVSVHWNVVAEAKPAAQIKFQVLDETGRVLVESPDLAASAGTARFTLQHKITSWTPDHPNLYRLRTLLSADGRLLDEREQSFGQREFRVQGLGFALNSTPIHLRMGTVVWHRWTRDPEAKQIAFDPAWFERNVVSRLKSEGANAMRYHLGLPPETFLDLCDRDGLLVQMEWPFFHGISASEASMTLQWRYWLDVAARHPSVVIVHAWNETEGEPLVRARRALDADLKDAPPFVVAHRDETPIHKYWWSLFENLGLYYDSATQFGVPVVVDEFGGDYLDGNGDPGLYPATQETFLRFLGRNSTREERLQLQADANARVGEYWRRLGVAGLSPFCILGSPQDGSNWFLGPTNVASPQPKPVWKALSAVFAQKSLSLEVWNRNFTPGERVKMPLWFFNDADDDQPMEATIHVLRRPGNADVLPVLRFKATMRAHSAGDTIVEVPMPAVAGEWRLEARLEPGRQPDGSSAPLPVASTWDVRTFQPEPGTLKDVAIGVPAEETELRRMFTALKLPVVDADDRSAKVVVGSRATWLRLHTDRSTVAKYEAMVRRGTSLVLLDAGPEPLGAGYAKGNELGGPLEGAPTVRTPRTLEQTSLFAGVKVSFEEVAEPESTIQTPAGDQVLWDKLPRGATWLWNGLRGGLIVPAADMQVSGLSGKALLSVWEARGADRNAIVAGHAFAYELAGYYAFSSHADDKDVQSKLRQRVRAMVEDAPALESVVNPNAPIVVSDLGAEYAGSGSDRQAESVTTLANAGKNLTRAPVVKLTFAQGSGSLVLSQVLTSGRLVPGEADSRLYALRYDPVTVQFVLNMLKAALEKP